MKCLDERRRSQLGRFVWFWSAAAMLLVARGTARAAELSIEDFSLAGQFGCHGAVLRKVGANHFQITLGCAPNHPDWCNMLYFRIVRNAQGNRLRLDVAFHGGNAYRFNHNACAWSYDAKHWQPIRWQRNTEDSAAGDTLLFPVFRKDTVYYGPHRQFGITAVLCEGSGDWTSRQACIEAGAALMAGIAEYYRGTK